MTRTTSNSLLAQIELHHDKPGTNSSGSQSKAGGSSHNLNSQTPAKSWNGLPTLIVEDYLLDQKLVANNAQSLGLNTTTVATATEAIELLKNQEASKPFELLIMDYKMPSLDGLAASNMIKNTLGLKSPPKIILMSSFHKDEIFYGIRQLDYVDSFVSKPATREKLECSLHDIQTEQAELGQQWPPQVSAVTNEDHEHSILSKTHVLLAEDNLINQRVAVGTLKRKGAQVTIANNGQEAIDKALAAAPGTFDIILMDIDMPKVDGYTATSAILGEPGRPHIPIVALTAHTADEDRKHCLELGMVDYLVKPVKPKILYESIIKHLTV